MEGSGVSERSLLIAHRYARQGNEAPIRKKMASGKYSASLESVVHWSV